ncbi:MAG: tetratricopeptide repeat protein [Proteobacteria bacterium]|nr:tetratricopeptide repeat protein [Pseudomonadota bacterium]
MTITDEFERAFRLHQQGKLREAWLRYEAVLAAEPRHTGALHYSGVVLYQSGKLPEAAERIRASIAVDAASADAWSNLALVLGAAGRGEAAVNALIEAAKLAPRSAAVHANLAAARLAIGDAAGAETSARAVLTLDPRSAAGWHNLALALKDQHRALEALDASARAVAIAPEEPAYSGVKAQLELAAGLTAQAHATLNAALARRPQSADLRFELAGVLEREGDVAAAMRAWEDVLRIEPRQGAALSQLMFLRQRAADWHDLAALRTRFADGVESGMPLLSPFVLLSQPSTRAAQRRCADQWVASLVGTVAADTAPPRPRFEIGGPRLRLGYLSADFHTHATAFLAAGLFEHHDRTRFDVVAYSTGPNDRSAMRARLVRGFDRFVDAAGFAPDRLAATIRADAIDILVDLKGHTEGAPPAVLALRPAPIQVHYLGYPGTLGDGLVDYLVGDTIVTPIEHAADYAETLVLLPGSYQVNDRERPIGVTPARADVGLADDACVLCCFNNSFKFNPEVFDAWMEIMRETPASLLWLLARPGDTLLVANLRREAAARGVDGARIVFAAPRPNAEYLALYRVADLFLDTWPYNAHTTASDALWAGCPVVTFAGETFAGRVAASLVSAAGLPELVGDGVRGYVAKAIALVRDPAARARLRGHLDGAGRQSRLFDTEATTRALEAAYVEMAAQYRRGRRELIRV